MGGGLWSITPLLIFMGYKIAVGLLTFFIFWDVTDEQLLIEMILPRGLTGQQIELLSCAT